MSNTHRHLPQQDSQPSESTRLTEATALTRRLTFDLGLTRTFDKNGEMCIWGLIWPQLLDGCRRVPEQRCRVVYFLVEAQRAILDFEVALTTLVDGVQVYIDLSGCRQVNANWLGFQ
jgi:hypothetical protein